MLKIIFQVAIIFIFISCDQNNEITDNNNTYRTLIETHEQQTSENCPTGGLKIQIGFDQNQNNILDPEEIESTSYICSTDGVDGVNGVDGADGVDGVDGVDGQNYLIEMSTFDSNDDCTTGGVTVNTGLDDDSNGILSTEEIQNTNYICNGETPKTYIEIIKVSHEPNGDNCIYGGAKTDTGLDENENGLLDDFEIVTTEYECNDYIENKLALPSKLYMLSDVQNNLYSEAFTKRWQPYDYSVLFSGVEFDRRLTSVASISNPEDSQKITIKIINNNNFLIIDESTVNISVGQIGIGSGKVTASIIGDSYTNGGFFKNALLENDYVPNLSLIGLRKTSINQYDEGRGGWSLNTYFSLIKSEINYNPFLQPNEKKYWGSTQFWKNAYSVFNNTDGDSFEPTYSAGRYDDYLHIFLENSGLKKNPEIGDVMFDTDVNSFIEWNGNSWINTDQNDYLWELNYSTYLTMWQLDVPDFLFIMLGVNDFIYENDPENIDFSIWNNRMELFKESYLSANPNGKFVVVIPCSTFGSLNNTTNFYTYRANASLWSCRKNIIDNFDLREDEQVYVIDGGINIDSEYGYHKSNTDEIIRPFETYNDDETIEVNTGVPHPYNSYPEIGKPFAAFIQHHRE